MEKLIVNCETGKQERMQYIDAEVIQRNKEIGKALAEREKNEIQEAEEFQIKAELRKMALKSLEDKMLSRN